VIRAGLVTASLLAMTLALPARGPQGAGEIRGRITDRDDVPVAGADVQVRMLDRVPAVRTRSASDGTFRVPNLRPGGYRVIARHEQFGTAIGEELWLLPGASVVTRLFMERPIRCAFAPAPGMARLHGTVVDWNGLPSPAYVRLFEGENGESWDRSRGTSAGVDGQYEIDHVPPGRHSLHVWIRGFEPTIYPVVIGPDQDFRIDGRLDLAKRKPAPAAAQPAPNPAPALLTASGGIHGRVTDVGSWVIPGATASLRVAGRTVEATTDTRGIYLFSNLLPGQYELRIALSGFRPHAASVTVSAGRWTSGDATLQIGEIEPNETAVRWKLRRSETPVLIRTTLGEISVAIARNDFVACADAHAYSPGRLELVRASPAGAGAGRSQLLFRIHHGPGKPAAPGSPVYGLRFDDAGHLVVLDPVTSQELAVEGRVVEGFDVIDRIRALVGASKAPVTIDIVSISRLVFL